MCQTATQTQPYCISKVYQQTILSHAQNHDEKINKIVENIHKIDISKKTICIICFLDLYV